jgi:hypothetical protein
MPELHDLLERRASRYEPPPDLFDRVLDRRRRRDRNRRVGTAVVALAVAAAAIGGVARAFLSGPGTRPAGQPPSPFVDTWVSTGLDGSTQTMVVRASGDEAVEVVVHDDAASVCSGAPSTTTGTGRLEGATELVIPSPVLTCDDGSEPQALSGPPLEEQLRNLTFVYDPETDALTDNLGAVWARVGGEDPSPEPTAATIQQTPSPSTSARHSPRPGEATFTSTIHGISIDYPSGWQTRPATEPWTGGKLNYDSPAADVIFDPALGDRLYLVLASQPLGSVSEDAWRDEVLAWLCTGNGMAFGSHRVDGADAFVITCGSTASAALIFTDTRGYLIRLVVSSDEPGLAETYDWDWHKAMLETVDLRPEDALDALSPSESP